METITIKEWRKIKSFNKHVGQDGIHYLMRFNEQFGTCLVPVEIIKGGLK